MSTETIHRDLQVLLLSESEERVSFGLNLALAAAASGVRVSVFFALRSAHWVCASCTDKPSIQDLILTVAEQGVVLQCCSACIHEHCGAQVEGNLLIEGVHPAGLASMVQQATMTTQTITV